jgi:hypothetical protein
MLRRDTDPYQPVLILQPAASLDCQPRGTQKPFLIPASIDLTQALHLLAVQRQPRQISGRNFLQFGSVITGRARALFCLFFIRSQTAPITVSHQGQFAGTHAYC